MPKGDDPSVAIVLLAAGASRRMEGRDKLMEEVAGQPLLRRSAQVALGTGCPVIVTLPPNGARAAALEGLAVQQVPVEEAQDGLSASIRAGLRARPAGSDAVLIVPADLPEITPAHYTRCLDAVATDPRRIYRLCDAAGRAGHPVAFPSDLFADLMALRGDSGARALIEREAARLTTLPCTDDGPTLDLDTPDDWAAYRRRRGESS